MAVELTAGESLGSRHGDEVEVSDRGEGPGTVSGGSIDINVSLLEDRSIFAAEAGENCARAATADRGGELVVQACRLGAVEVVLSGEIGGVGDALGESVKCIRPWSAIELTFWKR